LEADVSLDFSLAGPAFEVLEPTPELSLPLWHDEWHLFPDEPAISFAAQPQSQTVQLGGSAYFSCTVAASGTPGYQWFFNGVPMSGQNARTLLLPSVSYGHGGNYSVRVTAGNQTSNSVPATLTVVPAGVPSGMALIPGGSFTMGNCMDSSEGDSDELPLHSVYVSAFYMDKYKVTKALWDEVKTWNGGNGYSYTHAGLGKEANHPVHKINWYDTVKWCNARSQKEGLTPCYYNEAGLTTVYKTGTGTPYPKWNANGYRLPTEAEWEKAARGGASGHRFPWSDTDNITHSRANYDSSSYYAYDTSPTRGYHPTFNDGVPPDTSPVGYFAANGYGLYDMAGNLWEWCWDWYQSDWYSQAGATQNNARGPTGPLSSRVLRGGGWLVDANHTRCANRLDLIPVNSNDLIGFRCVKGL
jgi:formylglycine-generating enzyme required for sulfatase activity